MVNSKIKRGNPSHQAIYCCFSRCNLAPDQHYFSTPVFLNKIQAKDIRFEIQLMFHSNGNLAGGPNRTYVTCTFSRSSSMCSGHLTKGVPHDTYPKILFTGPTIRSKYLLIFINRTCSPNFIIPTGPVIITKDMVPPLSINRTKSIYQIFVPGSGI